MSSLNKSPFLRIFLSYLPVLLLFFSVTGLLGMNYYGFTTFVPSYIADNTENLFNNITSEIKAGIFPTIIFASGMMLNCFLSVIGAVEQALITNPQQLQPK